MLQTLVLSVLSVTLVYCGQTVVSIKIPLGTEVGGQGGIVLDGDSAPAKGAQQPPPLFSAHVYCDHGRPSQLLLSSCLYFEVRARCRRRKVNVRYLSNFHASINTACIGGVANTPCARAILRRKGAAHCEA